MGCFILTLGLGKVPGEGMRPTEEGIEYAHERGAKCYLTINIFPHNEDVLPIQKYLLKIRNVGIDAFLISDPGMFKVAPTMSFYLP